MCAKILSTVSNSEVFFNFYHACDIFLHFNSVSISYTGFGKEFFQLSKRNIFAQFYPPLYRTQTYHHRCLYHFHRDVTRHEDSPSLTRPAHQAIRIWTIPGSHPACTS